MVYILLFFLLVGLFRIEGQVLRMRYGPLRIDVPKEKATSAFWANITQRVDHFSITDKRKWNMRYIYNDECFVSGGPIFIVIGGEWGIGEDSVTAGTIYDLACEHGAYMFYTEHRYYGESYPTEDFSSENLKYLSTDQALADLAYFIKYQKENNHELRNSTVVVSGCSYAATLATWIRIKYPHLVDIAYASSGPLDAKVDLPEFLEVVNDNIGLVSSGCLSTIKSGISEVERMLETAEGVANVSSLFNTCQTLNTTEHHRRFFFRIIIEVFITLVQYANDGDIELACNFIQNTTGSDAAKIANFCVTRALGTNCMGSYEDLMNSFASTNLSTDASRPYYYQICTEVGLYQTTTSNNQPFGKTVPVDFYYNFCKDLFGEEFGEELIKAGTERTNLMYGSVTPEVTRLITYHGSVDPWHTVGILEDLNSTAITFYVKGGAHCSDLSPISDRDSVEMKEAKVAIRKTIAKWLNEI